MNLAGTYASIDTNFESAHSWHDLEVWLRIVVVVYQLAVDVAHGVLLWNQVKDNVAAFRADGLYYCGFHYDKIHIDD